MVISLSISAAFAFGPIRNRIYEFFKASHISLTAIFLAALF
jgi:hypothetical protein